MNEIEVIAVRDFDGFFKNLVNSYLDKITAKIKRIYVTADAYRPYGCAVTYITPDEVHMDFYAATRNGFGQLDMDGLINDLNNNDYKVFRLHVGDLPGNNLIMDYKRSEHRKEMELNLIDAGKEFADNWIKTLEDTTKATWMRDAIYNAFHEGGMNIIKQLKSFDTKTE